MCLRIIQYNVLLVLCGLFAVQAHAEDVKYYDIELIVFENLDPVSRGSEGWPSSVVQEPVETFVELGQPYPGKLPKEYQAKYTFRKLRKKDYVLSEEAKLLDKSATFRILLHTAWRQPGMDKEIALPVKIHVPLSGPSTAGTITTNGDAIAEGEPPRTYSTSLDGFIKIILARYLHVDADLIYTTLTTEPVATPMGKTLKNENVSEMDETDAAELASLPRPVIFRLQQKRRMRSKEIHYLDHPVLGVLIVATPFDPDKTQP